MGGLIRAYGTLVMSVTTRLNHSCPSCDTVSGDHHMTAVPR